MTLKPIQIQSMYIQIGDRKEIVSLTNLQNVSLADNHGNLFLNFSKDIKMNKGIKYVTLYLNTENHRVKLNNKIFVIYSFINIFCFFRNIIRSNKLLYSYKLKTRSYRIHESRINIIIPVYDDLIRQNPVLNPLFLPKYLTKLILVY